MESDRERIPLVDPFAHANERPQKEMLKFDTDYTTMDPEIAEVVHSIQELAESLLYHWKEFPIKLPPSVTEQTLGLPTPDDEMQHDLDYSKNEGVVNYKDLFIAPRLDEVEQVALDKHGNLKRLTKEQLAMIRKKAEFEVPSLNFQGQVHKWHLSHLLQKGTEPTKRSFFQDIARSLFLLTVVAKRRFVSDLFSVSQAIKGWSRHCLGLLDLIIGVPSNTSHGIDKELHKERTRYLIAELDIHPSLRKNLNAYCEYVKERCQRSQHGQSAKERDSQVPPIPYCYETPTGQEIDLRLFSNDLMDYCSGILSNILVQHSKGWQAEMKAKLIKHYQGQHLPNEEISRLVSEDIKNHYLNKVFDAIRTNSELEAIQRGLGDLLVNQAKSVLAVKKALTSIQENMGMHETQLWKDLFKNYPVRSQIPAWMDDQLESFKRDFIRQNLWTAHERAIALCEDEGLDQAAYFLRRDLIFIKERQPVLEKELEPVKTPNEVFHHSTWIWLPRNYKVSKSEDGGQYQYIPTVIRNKAPGEQYTASKRASFNVEKSTVRTTSTRYPFWRWCNFLHRTWSYFWNSLFLFGIIIPWASRFGIRALLWPKTFKPDLEVTQVDGSLYPSGDTETTISRLGKLWQNVFISRKNFEDAPDRGFLGKGFTRVFNQIWNYVFKGVFGSILTIAVNLVMCTVVTVFSLAAAITCPVWVPLGVLLVHIFFILVWDVDNADGGWTSLFRLFKVIVWNMLCQGILQPIFAIFVGVIVCPLSSFFVGLYAVLRAGLRSFWDFVMFHCVVKFKGRVPSRDSFLARRFAGPGLASHYFYQIHPEQALAAVEAYIETEETRAWQDQVLPIIGEPAKVYRAVLKKLTIGPH